MQHRRTGALALLLTLAAVAACNDDSPAAPASRVLTSVNVSVAAASIEVGQATTATAVGFDQDGAPIAIPPVTWASESQTTAGINPTTGMIFAIAPGTTRITATVDGKVGERTISVARAPAIRINEIQPRGDAPTGWIEFFNPTPVAVDLTQWTLADANFFGPTFTFPAGSVIPAGGLLVIEETSLPFGVDAADLLHLFSRFGVLVDVAFWTAQPTTTLGLCPGVLTAAIVVTTAPTKGTANACPPADAALGAGMPGAARSAR
jgi:hypothetical protein